MIGALYPILEQTDSITGRMIALAMCLQFQVSRNGIFWLAATAMCSASSAALAGKALARTSSSAKKNLFVIRLQSWRTLPEP